MGCVPFRLDSGFRGSPLPRAQGHRCPSRPGHFVIVFQYVLYSQAAAPAAACPPCWAHLVVYIGFSDMVRFLLFFVLHLAAYACRAAAAMVAARCLTSCCASPSTFAALASALAAYVALARAPVRSAAWRRAGAVLRDLSRSPPAGIANRDVGKHRPCLIISF